MEGAARTQRFDSDPPLSKCREVIRPRKRTAGWTSKELSAAGIPAAVLCIRGPHSGSAPAFHKLRPIDVSPKIIGGDGLPGVFPQKSIRSKGRSGVGAPRNATTAAKLELRGSVAKAAQTLYTAFSQHFRTPCAGRGRVAKSIMYEDSWYSFVPEVAKKATATVQSSGQGHRRKESLLQQPNVRTRCLVMVLLDSLTPIPGRQSTVRTTGAARKSPRGSRDCEHPSRT